MMKLEIFGPGCAKCEALAARVKSAADRLGLDHELVEVKDVAEMSRRGVILTPALAIDGEIRLTGKVPGEKEIADLLEKARPDAPGGR
jgi:small redox-active disulfide protein 2